MDLALEGIHTPVVTPFTASGQVDAASLVPYYLRPTDEAIIDHFAAVGAAVDVPVLPYEIPYRTGKRLASETILRLVALDCIAGMKYCPGAIDQDVLAVLAASTGKAVLCGDDPYIHPMLQLGAAGAISASATLATSAYVAMATAGARWRRGTGAGPSQRAPAHGWRALQRAFAVRP